MSIDAFNRHALTLNLKVSGETAGNLDSTKSYVMKRSYSVASCKYNGRTVIQWSLMEENNYIETLWLGCDRSYSKRISLERFLRLTLSDIEEMVSVILYKDDEYTQAIKIVKQTSADTRNVIKNLLK